MKTLLLAATILAASTVSKQSVEVQYLDKETEPVGAIVRTGVREFTEADGTKAFWITGKTLQELTQQVQTHKN